MRRVLAFVAMTAVAAEKGYVDPARCQPCHASIFASYSKTGMGRSFSKANTVPLLKEFTHPLSARVYSVMERGGSFYLRRTQLPAGAPLEKSIEYLIGSGNHSKTFVHRDGQGRLFELPVSWYSEGGGYWAMSPGYDRRDHSDFRREVSDTCLFCHNGYPSEANGGLAQGIDCQRCHGPGEEHVKSKGAIVNPAKLSRSLQMDVCMQCHLESASRTLPDAIRRFDRGPFSYRPGEPLERFKLYFQFAGDKSEARGGITVNNSAYGLRQSACFQKSGRLTCTTCHDPHVAIRGEEAERRYTAVCRSCHNTAHDPETRSCSGCHMPKRRTEDAVHVVMTDHFIRRRPEMGDAPIAERHDRQLGRVKLLYPERLSNGPESELYVALAQLSNSPNPVQDIPRVEQAIKAARPQTAEPYRALAAAYRKSGRADQAVSAYRTVLENDSGDAGTYVVLGEILSEIGRIDEAIAVVQAGVARLPRDTSLLNTLSVLHARQNRFDRALDLVSSALRIDGDNPLSWVNLGVCLQAKGDKKGAEAAYRQALLLQPDLARAREYLELVLR